MRGARCPKKLASPAGTSIGVGLFRGGGETSWQRGEDIPSELRGN